MKYIGSGLWALASAYLEIHGYGSTSVIFGCIGILILVFGSNKTTTSIRNINIEGVEQWPTQKKHR